MAGIYIHIPFCRRACSYCDFYFSVSKRHEDRFFRTLLTELQLRETELRPHPIDTVYFGGGTPSFAGPQYLEEVLKWIRRNTRLSPGAEITLEANPEDLEPSKLLRWKKAGINRLSIGVQALDDTALQRLNRTHKVKQIRKGLHLVRQTGFENVAIDLIYGIPQTDLSFWDRQIDEFLHWNFPHLSAYALTAEPRTLLHHQIRRGLVSLPPDETYEAMFFRLTEKLKKAGFNHYEISNWAKPGYESRHNSAYWEGKPYFGFGPSAHSYDGRNIRRWNVANLHRYIRAVEARMPWYESETLDLRDRFNEFIMTRLRTARGINPEEVKRQFPPYFDEFKKIAGALETEYLEWQNGSIRIKPRAWFMADGIIARFFITGD